MLDRLKRWLYHPLLVLRYRWIQRRSRPKEQSYKDIYPLW